MSGTRHRRSGDGLIGKEVAAVKLSGPRLDQRSAVQIGKNMPMYCKNVIFIIHL
jgi:hypothetical protein